MKARAGHLRGALFAPFGEPTDGTSHKSEAFRSRSACETKNLAEHDNDMRDCQECEERDNPAASGLTPLKHSFPQSQVWSADA
jgi:hypothetical protein